MYIYILCVIAIVNGWLGLAIFVDMGGKSGLY